MKEKEKIILEVLADIYIAILIIAFPLIVDSTGFFKIFECKYYSFLIISSMYLLATILVIIYFWLFKKINYFKLIKLSTIQWCAIIFLVINLLSCLFSPYFKDYNLFIGVGRGEGLINVSLYVLTFLCVSLFAKFKKRYILYFSISSILINTIAILQYIGFNPLNMYQNGIGTHNVSFMATIGNIDFLSALYCILLPISCAAFVFLDESKLNKTIHFLSVMMGSFILQIINVDSGKVAILAVVMLVLPYILLNSKRLSKMLIIFSAILSGYCINIIINPEYHYDLQSLDFYFQFNYIVILFIIIIGLLVFLSSVVRKLDYDFSRDKKKIKIFYFSMASCLLIGVLILYFYDFKSGILYEIHELLHGNFDDNFGTYRMFLWKRSLILFKDYPLIGTGPDTFAVRFMSRYTKDVMAIGEYSINDTAANVYLTTLVNIGLLGLLSYLSIIFFQIKKGIKSLNKYSAVLLIAIICFLIQDFFNLSVVIVTPIFWLLMALYYRSLCSNEEMANIDK